MAYTPEYVAGDVANVTVDFLVSIGVFAVSFATLIGLVLLFAWLKKHVKI